ncbi:MAG: hypothetical protein ABT02_09335 [Comamonadaceae bacterium SCN 68-20]|nr:MAG: hypothetical protein ABT02_09335 [Comamonadaceae bacterium SCN 68-20]OJX30537.1 MAG: hypothetical protein BGO75_20395 [Burkholderiales bacterium 68-20]
MIVKAVKPKVLLFQILMLVRSNLSPFVAALKQPVVGVFSPPEAVNAKVGTQLLQSVVSSP